MPRHYDPTRHGGRIGLTVGPPTAERLHSLARAHGISVGGFVEALVVAFDEDRTPGSAINEARIKRGMKPIPA